MGSLLAVFGIGASLSDMAIECFLRSSGARGGVWGLPRFSLRFTRSYNPSALRGEEGSTDPRFHRGCFAS